MSKILFKILGIGFLGFFFLIANQDAYAADICWTGGGADNNWNTGANWQGSSPPGTGDVAVFDNGTCTGTPNKNVSINTAISV